MASFTAEVKDELSRVEGRCATCEYAELSALLRVCGTLSFRGPGRYSLRVTTETGAVARTIVKLAHELFDLKTELTYRRSVLHKTRNYLIEIGDQEGLEDVLVQLGILVPGQGLAAGVPRALLQRTCCREAFIRGAFMASGFIADPRGDFHLEIAVTGEEFANELAALVSSFGVHARLNRRRGAYVIYLKSFDDIVTMLVSMGAARYAHTIEGVRAMKSVKNNTNRLVNAELANSNRASGAAVGQSALIDEAEELIGLAALPRAVREFCELRRANPDMSLAELGQELTPPASKSAMYHRLLRLEALVAEARASGQG